MSRVTDRRRSHDRYPWVLVGSVSMHRRVGVFALIAVVACLVISACGALGGSSSASGDNGGTRVTVSVLPGVDLAPFWRAVDQGYFREAGLDVVVSTESSGPDSVNKVVSKGSMLAYTSYPAAVTAHLKLDQGEQRGSRPVIVADGYAAAANMFKLATSPKSGIAAPQDLRGRRVAVSARGTISDLATMDVLAIQGVDVTTIQWVGVPFPNMIGQLEAGTVDAAVMIEPFLTKANTELGKVSVEVLDCATGPTANIPLAGWVATSDFAAENPRVVAAFRTALTRAVHDVTEDRAVLNQTLVRHAGVDDNAANLLRIGLFVATADGAGLGQRQESLQRVVDLMRKHTDVTQVTVPEHFSIQQMLVTG